MMKVVNQITMKTKRKAKNKLVWQREYRERIWINSTKKETNVFLLLCRLYMYIMHCIYYRGINSLLLFFFSYAKWWRIARLRFDTIIGTVNRFRSGDFCVCRTRKALAPGAHVTGGCHRSALATVYMSLYRSNTVAFALTFGTEQKGTPLKKKKNWQGKEGRRSGPNDVTSFYTRVGVPVTQRKASTGTRWFHSFIFIYFLIIIIQSRPLFRFSFTGPLSPPPFFILNLPDCTNEYYKL